MLNDAAMEPFFLEQDAGTWLISALSKMQD